MLLLLLLLLSPIVHSLQHDVRVLHLVNGQGRSAEGVRGR
jgi:hypothetical protein